MFGLDSTTILLAIAAALGYFLWSRRTSSPTTPAPVPPLDLAGLLRQLLGVQVVNAAATAAPPPPPPPPPPPTLTVRVVHVQEPAAASAAPQ